MLGVSLATVTIIDDVRAAKLGFWSGLFNTQIVAVHLHHLPDGTVLFWPGARDEHAGDAFFGNPRIWNPDTGAIAPISYPYNLFCSGHTFLDDGQLLVSGGHESLPPPSAGASGPGRRGLPNAAVFNYGTKSWTQLPDMNAGRWYPTTTTLPTGGALVVSGEIAGPYIPPPGPSAVINEIPQILDSRSLVWRTLAGAQFFWPLYPFMFVAPNGWVFHAGPNRDTQYLDPTVGVLTPVAQSSRYRADGSAVLYGDGKVLLVGGAEGENSPTGTAEVIDLNSSNPFWRGLSTGMTFPRKYATAVLLPDGTVLVVGGTSSGGFNDLSGAVLEPELWNPTTESWTTLAPMQVRRGYHSTAMLLRDGRVVMAGGGEPAPVGFGDNPDAQIFSPPYLFKGPRPTITSAPPQVGYAQRFFIATPDFAGIAAVNWIRLPSVTHAFDQNQRINHLSFIQAAGGVRVTAPPNPNLAPPGHYMLFILNTSGVPSMASIVKLSTDLAACDSTLSAESADAASTGGDGAVTVSVGSATCAWNASSPVDWVTIIGGTPAAGSGSVSYRLTPNSGSTIRIAQLSVAGKLFRITQAGRTAAPFADVATSDSFFDAVNEMRSRGITIGCQTNPQAYCPHNNVTRGQMAVFIVRASMGGDNFTFPPTPYFTDVPATHEYFKSIQKMRELGITTGCTPTTYCPDDPVTRGQMAVFIIRARLGSTTTFAFAPAPLFSDTPATHAYFRWIQKMKEIGITSGCTTTTYCPDDAVSRGQMAVLVMRGLFNLFLPATTPILNTAIPAIGMRGAIVTVGLTGFNTGFAPGATQISLGAGITASNITVTNATSLTVRLTIAGTSSLGPRSVVVTTGAREAHLPNGFIVQ